PALPGILRTENYRLFSPLPLTDREWKVLAEELEHFLGPEGYLWLSALAIYPALQWDITIYLGVGIKDHNGQPLYTETRAAALTQLPWLREGIMPDWLRRRLIAALPGGTRSAAVAQLWAIIRGADRVTPSGEVIRLRLALDRQTHRQARLNVLPDALQRD